MKKNQRKFPRIDSLNLVSIQHFDENQDPDLLTVGRTLDLSEGGIRLEVNQAVPLFSKVSLMLAIHEPIIKARGRVVYLAVEGDLVHMGLDFVGLGAKDRKAIRDYLAGESL